MKKLSLFLIFISCIALDALAQASRSDIQFKLRNNKLLTVIMDGRHYKRYGNTITFGDVPTGMHEVKVYRYYPNDDLRYADSKAKAVLLYKGKMRIDPNSSYYCTIDPEYKTMSIRESREALYNNEKTYRIEEQPEFDEDRNNKWNDDFIDNDNENNKIKPKNDPNFLSNDQLFNLKTSVEERMSSTDKVSLIQNYLQNKKVNTNQVKIILGWLSFENSKLQIAKFCYPLATDKENYLQISSLLSFQNSKRELEDLMYSNKKNNQNNSNNQNTNRILSNEQLNQLGIAVQEKITDTDKQKLLQKSLSDNPITTAQVATMIDWLTFEGSKLEFAQWAYPKTSDRANYTQLKNKFSFLSSKKAIDDMIIRK